MTGVGLIVTRIPPLGLQEGIIRVIRQDDGSDDDSSLTIVYKILNPGWLTFPVQDHCGWIRFCRFKDPNDGSNDLQLEWIVKWTPMRVPLFQQPFNDAIRLAIQSVIDTASDYMSAARSKEVIA